MPIDPYIASGGISVGKLLYEGQQNRNQLALEQQRTNVLAEESARRDRREQWQQNRTTEQDSRAQLDQQKKQELLGYYARMKAGDESAFAEAIQGLSRSMPGFGELIQRDPAIAKKAALDAVAMTLGIEPEQAAGSGIKIGAYNPGDYTPASWAQFLQTNNPAGLQRQYAPQQAPTPVIVNTPGYGVALVDRRTGEPIRQFTTPEQEAQAGANAKRVEAEASAAGQATVEQGKKQAEREAAWNLYETAMAGLRSGLEGSQTGPVAGRIPAVTAAQQTAEGGVAAMAPVLKQLFRVAGEGVFTDRDQQLLLDMVPKRTDLPQARSAKIANIDGIVRAKLGMAATPAPASNGGLTPEERAELEALRKKLGR